MASYSVLFSLLEKPPDGPVSIPPNDVCLQGASGAVLRVLFTAAIVIGAGYWAKSEAMAKPKASASNSCKMTYSRSPQYVRLPVAEYPVRVEGRGGQNADDFPGYGYRLLRCMDGKLPANERAKPSKPGGIPVLFVPGHMGSYKQV